MARIAREHGCRRIVDLGCGTARKLVEMHPHYDIIGVDYGSNIGFCRSTYAWGRWIEHDLDSAAPLPLSAADLQGSVIVAADVIEHLQRPERLLAALRLALRHASAAVLSTPERDLTWGAGHRGPPPNECHVREWNQEELRRFLADEGLADPQLGLTRSNNVDPSLQTLLAIVPAG
ncbi:MAG: class I SAM-dependent methyltransferase [Solirubrobacteraceae bacterium]